MNRDSGLHVAGDSNQDTKAKNKANAKFAATYPPMKTSAFFTPLSPS